MHRRELLDLAQRTGLGEYGARVGAAARDCLRLTPVPTEEHRLHPGASRFGGLPDLGPGQEWPRWDRGPLGFIAQLDLKSLAPSLPPGALPGAGWLSFFYNPQQDTWGFDPRDAGGFRVLYTPPDAQLRRLVLPADLSEQGQFEACELLITPDLSLPSRSSDHFTLAGLQELPGGPWDDLMEALWGEHGWGARSKLFGYADEIQNPMEEECALASGGVYCGDGSATADPRTAGLRSSAQDWELLLQVNTHDEASMMWGDMGAIYYWLRGQDRRAGRFDRSWLILQCG